MSIFGVTGQISSGKSTVVKLLKKKGAIVFDADKVIHSYYKDKKSKVYKKLKKLFPQAFCRGKISRTKLAQIVLSSRVKLRQLERIVHPRAIRDLKQWIKKAKKRKIYIAEVPLLFEKKLESYFDGIILVCLKKGVLIKRMRKRFKISKKEALARLTLQFPLKGKIKRSDFIINNRASFNKLKKQTSSLWRELKNKE